jgi:hypothetical protein
MILGLGAAFCYCDDFASIIRSLGEKLEKCSLGDVVRAGASDQIPARFDDLHRPEIDFLISALRGRDAIAVLSESGRIEHNHIEAPAHLVIFLKQIEGICLAKSDV